VFVDKQAIKPNPKYALALMDTELFSIAICNQRQLLA
jgi:hypothetical protein